MRCGVATGEGRLESEEVSGLAGVESPIHIGCDEDPKVWWECQLIKGEDVMEVGSGCMWIEEQSPKM